MAIQNDPQTVTTIQLTGKRYKAARALAKLLFIVAAVWTFIEAQIHTPPVVGIGLMIVAVAGYAYGRIGGWWHHS